MTQRAHPIVGQKIIYVDPHGIPCDALVTITWNHSQGLDGLEGSPDWQPGISGYKVEPKPEEIESLKMRAKS